MSVAVASPVPPSESTTPAAKGRGAIIGIVLVVVLVVGALYGVSYQSARGLRIGDVKGRMSYRTGLFGYAEFDISVTISSASILDTNISQVSFGLTIDSLVPFSAIQAQGSTFSPGQSLEYTLRFSSSNPSDLQYISQGGTHQVTVSITAWSSSGIYSGWVMASSSSNWNWSSAS